MLGLRGFRTAGLGLADVPFTVPAGDNERNAQLLAFQKDLGITLLDKRANATIKAFQNPADALKDYQEARKGIDLAALEVYKKAGTQAEAAGLAKDVAVQYARKRSHAYHEAELELLNLTHPFADSPEGLVALASGAKRRDILGKEGAAAPAARG